MFLDDTAFIIKFWHHIARVYRDLEAWCEGNDMRLNMGPNKTAIVFFSNKRRNRVQWRYTIPDTDRYRYLGKQIQLRANSTVHLNAWKTT